VVLRGARRDRSGPASPGSAWTRTFKLSASLRVLGSRGRRSRRPPTVVESPIGAHERLLAC
jgi:hypothetical protein